MKIHMEKNKDKVQISFIGKAILKNMHFIKTKLDESINTTHIVLDITQIDHYDFSFIQFIYSFIHTYSIVNNNQLRIIPNQSHKFLKEWIDYGLDPDLIQPLFCEMEKIHE